MGHSGKRVVAIQSGHSEHGKPCLRRRKPRIAMSGFDGVKIPACSNDGLRRCQSQRVSTADIFATDNTKRIRRQVTDQLAYCGYATIMRHVCVHSSTEQPTLPTWRVTLPYTRNTARAKYHGTTGLPALLTCLSRQTD
jgi:hypothetical protein